MVWCDVVWCGAVWCVSCVMREERWTGDEEGDEEVQVGEKGDEEIEHDNALETLQLVKTSETL